MIFSTSKRSNDEETAMVLFRRDEMFGSVHWQVALGVSSTMRSMIVVIVTVFVYFLVTSSA